VTEFYLQHAVFTAFHCAISAHRPISHTTYHSPGFTLSRPRPWLQSSRPRSRPCKL